jgi:hypothetical protein
MPADILSPSLPPRSLADFCISQLSEGETSDVYMMLHDASEHGEVHRLALSLSSLCVFLSLFSLSGSLARSMPPSLSSLFSLSLSLSLPPPPSLPLSLSLNLSLYLSI